MSLSREESKQLIAQLRHFQKEEDIVGSQSMMESIDQLIQLISQDINLCSVLIDSIDSSIFPNDPQLFVLSSNYRSQVGTMQNKLKEFIAVRSQLDDNFKSNVTTFDALKWSEDHIISFANSAEFNSMELDYNHLTNFKENLSKYVLFREHIQNYIQQIVALRAETNNLTIDLRKLPLKDKSCLNLSVATAPKFTEAIDRQADASKIKEILNRAISQPDISLITSLVQDLNGTISLMPVDLKKLKSIALNLVQQLNANLKTSPNKESIRMKNLNHVFSVPDLNIEQEETKQELRKLSNMSINNQLPLPNSRSFKLAQLADKTPKIRSRLESLNEETDNSFRPRRLFVTRKEGKFDPSDTEDEVSDAFIKEEEEQEGEKELVVKSSAINGIKKNNWPNNLTPTTNKILSSGFFKLFQRRNDERPQTNVIQPLTKLSFISKKPVNQKPQSLRVQLGKKAKREEDYKKLYSALLKEHEKLIERIESAKIEVNPVQVPSLSPPSHPIQPPPVPPPRKSKQNLLVQSTQNFEIPLQKSDKKKNSIQLSAGLSFSPGKSMLDPYVP